MSTRIAVLHAAWIEHPEMGADEISVLAVLALHADRNGSCFPSQGLLARLLGRSRPWVCKVIRKLSEIGILLKTNQTRQHDGGNRACLYKLTAPESKTTSPALDSSQSPQPDIASQSKNRVCPESDIITPEIKQREEPSPARVAEDKNYVSQDSTSTPQLATIPAEDWKPTDQTLIWALDHHPDTDLQAARDKYVNKCRAKGYRYICHDSAFRTWLAEDASRAISQTPLLNRGKVSPAYARFATWRTVAAQAGERRHAA